MHSSVTTFTKQTNAESPSEKTSMENSTELTKTVESKPEEFNDIIIRSEGRKIVFQ
jgi:hypothetical protein